MSLEAAILANTAAVTELTAVVKASNEGRAAAVEALSGAAPAAAKPRGRPAGAKAEKDPPAAAAAETPATPAAMTVDEFRAAVGKFMDTTDEAVRAERRAFVKAMIDHFAVDAVVKIPAEHFAQVVGWTDAFLRGETVNFSEGEDGGAPAVEEEPDLLGD